MFPLLKLSRCLALGAALLGASALHAAPWSDELKSRVEKIDRDSPGKIGVFVKRLDNGETLSYQADTLWYLGSAVKVPIALAVMQEVEDGKQSLDRKLTLQETDKIDGSGDVVWQKDGTSYSLDALLEDMLVHSDNTAANMLIRAIGLDTLNKRSRSYLGRRGFREFTDFSQVRRDVYAQLHPDAAKLSNTDLVKIAGASMGPERVAAVRRALSMEKDQLKLDSLETAYRQYYAKGLNSVTLEAYGGMLEQLVRGKLIKKPEHLQTLFKYMKIGSYDAYRLEAGLPKSAKFIHKTGTQFERACHAGVIHPEDGAPKGIVVVACAQDMDESKAAARAFEQVGAAITQTVLKAK